MNADCCHEVAALHRFFEDWFLGRCPDSDDHWLGLEHSLDPEFVLIGPDGRRHQRSSLLSSLRTQHGTRARVDPEFRIWTRGCVTRLLSPGLWLVGYEEHQLQSGVTTRRLSSALLRENEQAPRGLLWLWVHETWLPDPAPETA